MILYIFLRKKQFHLDFDHINDKELLNLVYEIYEKDFISFGYKKFIIYENNILSMIETDYLEMEKEKNLFYF